MTGQQQPPPLLAPPAPSHPLWPWLLGLALVTAVVVLHLFNPTVYAFYPQCQFYQLTHLYCPGCGGLRAVHALTHGNFVAAFHCNPLLIVSLPVLAIWLLRRKYFSRRPTNPTPKASLRAVWFWFAILVLFGILRNIPGPAFFWMLP